MPRLSRTAKYADLRAQLANDKEEQIESKDLSSYQDRLNNVQDTLSFASQEVKKEEPKQETKSYFDTFMKEEPKKETTSVDYSSYFETALEQNEKNRPSIEEIYSDVFDDVKDNSGEIVSIKERDTYLNQTFSDVNAYNKINNQPTINTIVDESVNEVRHPEIKPIETPKVEPIDNTFAWSSFNNDEKPLDADKVEEEIPVDDEEFSNTVSMEITKIMDEISNTTEVSEVKEAPFAEVKIEEPQVQETIQINEVVAEEKPEEVVEIKNISEMKEEPIKDTMSSTIPFVVAAEDEALVEEEEDEESGSNTVLNVILIVLIIVLIAVLGLIVFYILKTKGIF